MPLQLDPLEGLGGFGGLEGLERPVASGDGQPLLLAIALIDEDPGQPRQEFEPQALQELAESIAEHGVLQPVSVHARADAYSGERDPRFRQRESGFR
ncbi:ParB N-terminal domain-containing protein [Roseateles sp. GG27B]